jgi:hypothetical protein
MMRAGPQPGVIPVNASWRKRAATSLLWLLASASMATPAEAQTRDRIRLQGIVNIAQVFQTGSSMLPGS